MRGGSDDGFFVVACAQTRSWRHCGLRGSVHSIRLRGWGRQLEVRPVHPRTAELCLEVRYTGSTTIDLGTSSQTFPPRRTGISIVRTVKTRPVDIGTKDTSGSGCDDAVELQYR
jgi:hypothetical protein